MFLHIQLPDHSVRSSFESGLFLQFPAFEMKAIVGQNDLYLDATPLRSILDSNVASHVTDCSHSVCCNLFAFQEEINQETNRLDNLLLSLSQYYDTVKTKRQLQLEMPTGFRQISDHQRDYQSYYVFISNFSQLLVTWYLLFQILMQSLLLWICLHLQVLHMMMFPLLILILVTPNHHYSQFFFQLFDPWINHRRLFRILSLCLKISYVPVWVLDE